MPTWTPYGGMQKTFVAGCLSSSSRRLFAFMGKAVLPNQASDKVSKASGVRAQGVALLGGVSGGALWVGDGEWKPGGRKQASSALSARSSSAPASLLWPLTLPVGPPFPPGGQGQGSWPLRPQVHRSFGGMPRQPCPYADPYVWVFQQRLLCLGSWAPGRQEVAGQTTQGLSKHQGAMGSPTERHLAGARARWGWATLCSHHPEGPPPSRGAQAASLPRAVFPIFSCVGLTAAL